MSCDCIANLNRKLFEIGSNTSIKVGQWFDPNTGASEFRILIPVEKQQSNKRKSPSPIKPTYCPFCGKKYESPKQQETTQEAL